MTTLLALIVASFVVGPGQLVGPGEVVRVHCRAPRAEIVRGIADPEGHLLRIELPLRHGLYGGGVARLGRTHVRNLDDDATIRVSCP